jgi:hypothetical protein
MTPLLHSLREKRDVLAQHGSKIVERGAHLADVALGKVQTEALDWRRTLAARREALGDEARGGWSRLLDFQTRVLDETERVLASLAARVRARLERLGNLELAERPALAPLPVEATVADPPRAEPVDAELSSAPLERVEAPEVAQTAASREAAPVTDASASAVEPAAETPARTPRARRPKKPARDVANAPKRFVLPINGYDELTVKDILAELPRLTPAQCQAIRDFEAAHKNRKTVLSALDARLLS